MSRASGPPPLPSSDGKSLSFLDRAGLPSLSCSSFEKLLAFLAPCLKVFPSSSVTDWFPCRVAPPIDRHSVPVSGFHVDHPWQFTTPVAPHGADESSSSAVDLPKANEVGDIPATTMLKNAMRTQWRTHSDVISIDVGSHTWDGDSAHGVCALLALPPAPEPTRPRSMWSSALPLFPTDDLSLGGLGCICSLSFYRILLGLCAGTILLITIVC